MRTIVHLSDLHFGRIHKATLRPLLERVCEIDPDIVIVSGDLTQHALGREFASAKKFLEHLPQPQVVIPGNHDVPLFRPFRRILAPMSLYHRHFSEEAEPIYVDGEMAVIGINTARGTTIDSGKISTKQMLAVKSLACELPKELLKIIVIHHPIDQPKHGPQKKLVGRARLAMKIFAECGADLILCGHRHVHFALPSSERYTLDGYSALVVQAGTATSTRTRRGESNGFNVIRAERPCITVERYLFDEDAHTFELGTAETFEHSMKGWEAAQAVD